MFAPVNTKQDQAAKTEGRNGISEEVSSFGFTDQRPEASQLKTLKAISENSTQAGKTTQLQQLASKHTKQQLVQKKDNNTGLPDNLKSGVENLSGYAMDDVKVHYNSDKPATLQAYAYAQGTDIHIAPGQEKHLPHEAWHVAQQKQGRVQATKQLKGTTHINDDAGLEKEADVMGIKALDMSDSPKDELKQMKSKNGSETVQLATEINHTTGTVSANGEDQMVGKEVYAKLDPKDPIKGSATGVNTEWMKWIRRKYPAANVVRGHLLNHDLGGFGIEENLYPISTLANANHSSKVEQKVKGALTDLDNDVTGPDQGRIHYRVSVDESNSYEHARFLCSWQTTKNHQVVKGPFSEPIESKLTEDKGGFGGGRKNEQSPADWRHGKNKGGTEVKAIRTKLAEALESGKIKVNTEVKDHGGNDDGDLQDALELLNDLVDDFGINEAYNALVRHLDVCEEGEKVAVKYLMQLLVDEYTH